MSPLMSPFARAKPRNLCARVESVHACTKCSNLYWWNLVEYTYNTYSPVPDDAGHLTTTYAGSGCTSGPDSSLRRLLAIHSRMKVLLIFVLFNNSGSSLSNATSLAEMTSITKVSRVGNPSSLRFLSTVCKVQVRTSHLSTG